MFVAWLAAVRTRPNATDRHSLSRGVRDPTDPAGDRWDSSPRSVAAAAAAVADSRGGPAVRSDGRGERGEDFAAVRHDTEGERRGPRRGQRAAADTAAGDYIACRRGTVSSYPRRPPCSDWPDSLPRKRTGFSPRLLFRFSSPPDLSRHSLVSLLSLSLSFLPIVCRSCRGMTRSSLSVSRRGTPAFPPCLSRKSHLAVLRRSTGPIFVSVLSFYVLPCPSFGEVLVVCPPSFGS